MALDFGITEEQRAILDSVDKFMSRAFPPDMVRDYDLAHRFPDHLLEGFGELGILGLPFPEEYGGLGADWMTVVLVQEHLGRHAAIAAALYSITIDFGGMSILHAGTENQKQGHLPDLIEGKTQYCLALTEPEAGTDAAALRTRAVRTADGWRLAGRKTWISCADSADYLVTACRTSEGDSKRHGISMLLVPKNATGVHMTALPKIGNNSMPSFDIAFDNVEIPGNALLGEEGDGFRVLMSTLQYSRSGQAANTVGQSQAVVDMVSAYVKERVQFGAPLSQFQVLRHRLVDMQMRVDQARLMLYQLAWKIDTGQRARSESAMAKILASETLQYVTHHGMQMMASAAYAEESDLSRHWRDARLYTFGEGTNEMLRDLIAREMGL